MCTTNIPWFFLKLIYPKTLLQTILDHIDDEVVKYKVKKIFNKKFR